MTRTKVTGSVWQLMSIFGISILLIVLLAACSTPTTVGTSNTPSPTENNLPPEQSIPSATSIEGGQINTPTTPATNTPDAQPTQTESPPTQPPTPTIVVTPPLGIGSSRVSEIDGMEQVYVPAGEFLMGSADPEAKTTIEGGRAYPEIPQHTVYLDGYWIDKFEVANRQYKLCEEAGVCDPPHDVANYTYPRYYGYPEFENYPVVWVSWFQARKYCEWAGRRLPTEAEWEKAARGTDGRKYPWGNEPLTGERANFCDINCTRSFADARYDDGYPDTAPVGSYPAGASPYGAMDMSGNVWEWVSSLIMPYPYDANDGREDLEAPGERAWRGGPWSNGYWWMRSSVRYRSVNFYKWYVLGIRCASSE